MKVFTDISQGKKLAEILPIESADMGYIPSAEDDDGNILYTADFKSEYIFDEDCIPCWSLGALLDVIPYPTLGKHANETWSCASWVEKVNPYFVEGCDSPINACYEMIIKLNELKML